MSKEAEMFKFLEECYYEYKDGRLDQDKYDQLELIAPDWVAHVESELAKSQDINDMKVGGKKRYEIYEMLHNEPAAILLAIDNIWIRDDINDNTKALLEEMESMVINLQKLFQTYEHALKLDQFEFKPPIIPIRERMSIISQKPLFAEVLEIFEAINKLNQQPELDNSAIIEIWFQNANAQDRLEIIDAYYKENAITDLGI